MQNERIFIGLGSNLGHREAHLEHGRNLLSRKAGRVVQASPLWASPAWGFEGKPFLNQVVELQSELHPVALLRVLLEIEDICGRQRHAPGYQNRTLDLDLIYYGKRRSHAPDLVLPHPHLSSRRFVLAPLASIAPDWTDPVSHMRMDTLLQHCNDTQGAWH